MQILELSLPLSNKQLKYNWNQTLALKQLRVFDSKIALFENFKRLNPIREYLFDMLSLGKCLKKFK